MPGTRRTFLLSALGAAAGLPSLCRAAGAAGSGWEKSAKNPVLSLGAAGEWDSQNLFAPAAAKVDGQYFLFYAGGPAGPRTNEELVRYQLGLALSKDGETWKKTGKPLLPLGERDDFHCTPALLRDPAGDLLRKDGRWHMVFCGNRADDVEHATSRDGLTWEKDPRSPIYRRAYSPSLVQAGDEVRMYYIEKPAARDGQRVPWQVSLATGPDLYSLRPHPASPVLRISQSWETGALVYPYVLKEGETWVMFYAAYWTGYPGGKQATAIGMATSPDGLRWTKSDANPVLTPSPDSAYDRTYNSSQSVIRDGDLYRMYFAGRIDQVHKYYSIGLATKRGKLVTPLR